MGMFEEVMQGLRRAVSPQGRYRNMTQLAEACGVAPNLISRWLSGERSPRFEALSRVLESLGARVVFPGEDEAGAGREVCFVKAETPSAAVGPGALLAGPVPEDYLAVPMISARAAWGAGLIPDGDIEGWVLVWRHHPSVRHKTNLVALEMPKGERSMLPLFSPGDILMVDRNDRDPEPAGKAMLVHEPGPGGGAAVRRVATRKRAGDYELIFYSDNAREFPPTTWLLKRDYGGDMGRAVAGHVIWAWSDVREK